MSDIREGVPKKLSLVNDHRREGGGRREGGAQTPSKFIIIREEHPNI
jgi:hypothetical protein